MARLSLTAVTVVLAALLLAPITAIPATAAPVLAPTPVVQGNRLVDSRTNATFVPRGVNWPSFEYACWQGWGYSGANSVAEAQAIASWKANTVRLPLNQDCWLGLQGSPAAGTAAGYRAAVRSWVDKLNAAGLVVILDLHSSAPAGYPAHGQRAMADAQSLTFWQSVAAAYAASPSVMFDVFNEPYSRWAGSTKVFDMTWSCWKDGGCLAPVEDDYTATLSGATYSTVGMTQLVAAVRAGGAAQPIMLGGIDYSNDLRGFLANRPNDTQLVASWHNYPGQRCSNVTCWNSEVAPVAAVVPVVTGEFGQTDGGSGFLTSFMAWADTRGIGYMPWAWWDVSDAESITNSRYALYSGSSFTPKAPSGTVYHDHLAALAGTPLAPVVGSVAAPTASAGRITFSGWAVRPDAPSGQVSLAVNIGAQWLPFATGVADAIPPTQVAGAGPNQGFSGSFAAPTGTQTFCVWASPTSGPGVNLGCRTVVVPAARAAVAALEAVTAGSSSAVVSGWAVWPDAPATTVNLAVQVGSSWFGVAAGLPSAAAESAVPGSGPNHGFSSTIALAPGTHQVCLWTSQPVGAATMVGCRSVTVAAARPAVAALESVTVSGSSVVVGGWAVWPDSPATSVNLAVQVGASWYGAAAALPSAAAQSAVPGVGPNHGFSSTIPVGAGTHQVCLWTSQPSGGATLVGCRSVRVF